MLLFSFRNTNQLHRPGPTNKTHSRGDKHHTGRPTDRPTSVQTTLADTISENTHSPPGPWTGKCCNTCSKVHAVGKATFQLPAGHAADEFGNAKHNSATYFSEGNVFSLTHFFRHLTTELFFFIPPPLFSELNFHLSPPENRSGLSAAAASLNNVQTNPKI